MRRLHPGRRISDVTEARPDPSLSGPGRSMPYWRLSGFYFFFFASLGALTPYWPLYLESLGFTPLEIGELMAILLATKVVSPNLWAWMADRSSQALPVARTAAMLAFTCFLGLYWAASFWWVALVMFGFSFFWHAVLPQVETAALNHLGAAERRYGRIRLWGSFGFILFVLVLGPVVDKYGAAIALPAVALALLCVWATTMLIPDPGRGADPSESGSFRSLFTNHDVLVLLLCCLLMQASHAPYYTFFSIYLNEYGYTKSLIGGLWAFGVLCEVVVFYFMHRLHLRYRPSTLLAFSFVVTALRWVLTALFPGTLPVIVFAQSLHAVTFGVYHAAALQLIRARFKGNHQNRGVALYGSVGFGIGGALGSLLSGYLWSGVGAGFTFGAAAVTAICGALLAATLGGVETAPASRASPDTR